MNVTYQPGAEQWPEGIAMLQPANAKLEKALGRSAPLVAVEWERRTDEKKRPLYRLTLKDSTGTARDEFTPEQLRNDQYVHISLNLLWGDLLKIRSDLIHEQALAMAAAIEDATENQ